MTMRFNGAALFQVRKGERDDGHRRRLRRASMGPHFFKCGKCCRPIIGAKNSIPGFNGAALFQVRKVDEHYGLLGRVIDMLQWGRTFSSAERSSIH